MSTVSAEKKAGADIDLTSLEKSLRHPRTFFNAFLSALAILLSLTAMLPLLSVMIMLLYHGCQRLSLSLFTEVPPAAGMAGGGIGNALLGTIVMVFVASLISVPVGILAGVYLAEFGPDTRTATAVRFAAKVLTGLPSILAGVFAYALVVTVMHTFSALAGGVALSILMLPTVILTAEDAIRMVPQRMREAALGMGCTRTQMVLHIVLPTARAGLLTGVMLAVARAAGETAPLLFTALFSDYWLRRVNEPTASLAVLIYDFSGQPYPNQIEIAWAASLVLVLIVLGLNIASQVYLRRFSNPSRVTAMTTVSSTNGNAPHANGNGIIDVRLKALYYGSFKAVRDTHLNIKKNAITAFIGPSGCGKSTVLRSINRMNDLVRGFRFDGHVHFRGTDIYDKKVDPVAVRRHIGMVFQQPNPFAMSIYRNVSFGLRLNRYQGSVPEKVEKALRGAALWDEVKDKLHASGLALSGGQQQRLCIARAIATEPEVLLMDEPCSALDPVATRKIEELMIELKQRFTIVTVTHNLQQAKRVADLTGFLYVDTTQGGRTGYLVEYGPTEQVFNEPKEKHTKDYIQGAFS